MMVHKCTKIVNLFLMGSLGTQSLKEFKMSNVLNLKNTLILGNIWRQGKCT